MPNYQFVPRIDMVYTFDGSGSAYENHTLNGKKLQCVSIDAVDGTLVGAEFEVEQTRKRVYLSSEEIFWGIRYRKHPQPEPQTKATSTQPQ